MKRLTNKDFVQMSWEDYQKQIEVLYRDINEFLNKNNLTIDFIVPVLRGGGIPAISLSYMLKTHKMFPLQLKHNYKNRCIEIVDNSLTNIIDTRLPYIILLVDGYHASGRTSYLAFDLIKELLPNSSVIYATIGRDIGFLIDERDFLFSCSGFLSNECGVVSKKESKKEGILTKYTLFPWEILEDEIKNMNDELKYER